MAFQKAVTLPNGTPGDYIRLGTLIYDRVAKQCSVEFYLYTSAKYGAQFPVVMLAKLRLDGDLFDKWLSPAVLADSTIEAQCYKAAKVEKLMAGGGLTAVDLGTALDV